MSQIVPLHSPQARWVLRTYSPKSSYRAGARLSRDGPLALVDAHGVSVSGTQTIPEGCQGRKRFRRRS